MVSSRPAAFASTWRWKRARWSTGSLSSEKAFACSTDDEKLEAVDARRISIVAARERRGVGRVLGDEGRPVLGQRLLAGVVEQRAHALAVRVGLAQHRAQLV